jgi:hypothetical protein
MSKLSLVFGGAVLVALGGLATAAQAQPHHGDRGYRNQVIVVPAPPPPVYRVVRPGYDYRHDARRDHHHDYRRDTYRHAHGYHPRDRDGDGVPNRYDRRPDNPYRR